MKILFTATISIVVLAFLVPVGMQIYNQCQNGPCILTVPYGELEGGRISVEGGGLFGSGRTVYDLSYPGTCYRSRKKCSVWVGVTEGEYERQMYGVKR